VSNICDKLLNHDFILLTGAALVYFLKPTTKRLALYYAIINVASIIFLAGFFVRCSTHDIAGITVSYHNRYVCARVCVCACVCVCVQMWGLEKQPTPAVISMVITGAHRTR